MNSKLKIGELFLYKDEWKVCFSCYECGLEFEHIEQFIVHSLNHSMVVTSDEVNKLFRQINESESCFTSFNGSNEASDGSESDSPDEEDNIGMRKSYEKTGKSDAFQMNNFTTSSLDDHVENSTDMDSVFEPELPSESDFELSAEEQPKSKTPTTQKQYKKKNGTYVCSRCGAVLRNASNYIFHIKRHLNIRPHKCGECDKRCFTGSELKTHMRSHTGERPYKCQICGQTYKNSSMLAVHRRRAHTKERPHMCTYCAKTFPTLQQMREHETTHTDERKHVCPVCRKSFKRRSALTQHMLLHGEKKYTCNVCGNKFAQNAGLHAHMKMHAKTFRDVSTGENLITEECG